MEYSLNHTAGNAVFLKMRLNKEIIRLSLPAILSNITIPLLGLSDTVITGHLPGARYIAAISIGTLMFNTVFWLFTFLRMGTTGLTAQSFGAKDMQQCRQLLSRSFFLAVALGLLLVALQKPLSIALTYIISPGTDILPLALDYYHTCIWGAPALLGYLSLIGWMIGMQNTVAPMLLSIITNVVNISLSIIFVFPLNMGFIGVAYGTLAANWIGLLLALAILRCKWHKSYSLSFSALKSLAGYGRFFRVNIDIFLRSACILAVSMACGALGARIGTIVVAANAVLLNFYHVFSYFMDGFAFTAEALTGRFIGAGDDAMLKKAVRYLLAWGAGCALVFFAFYLFAGDAIIALITDNPDVTRYAQSIKTFIVLLPPLTVLAFMFDGFFIGATATRRMLGATVIATLAFMIIVIFHPLDDGEIFSTPSNNILWTAFLTYLFLRGALLSIQWPRMKLFHDTSVSNSFPKT